jgi:AcrR family transcriptional regulator
MKRMTPTDRKASVLEAAIVAAQKHTFAGLRLSHIAEQDECSNATVIQYFKTMTQMRRAVMRAAIKRRLLPLIAQGVAIGDPTASKADTELKKAALASMAN